MLIDHKQGKRHAMDEVAARDIPARSVRSVKRGVEGIDAAWAFGKEFISILRNHDLPRMDGRAGAFYCIWWGEVSDDSDGPLKWCRPVPTLGEAFLVLAKLAPSMAIDTGAEHKRPPIRAKEDAPRRARDARRDMKAVMHSCA
jgi:hypothetical protein